MLLLLRVQTERERETYFSSPNLKSKTKGEDIMKAEEEERVVVLKSVLKKRKRFVDGSMASGGENEQHVSVNLQVHEKVNLEINATMNVDGCSAEGRDAPAKKNKRNNANSKNKSVNFSRRHLENIAGVADDIDREAWELPRTCDGCALYILGERWSCKECLEEPEDEFDLCKGCFLAFVDAERADGSRNGGNGAIPWNNDAALPGGDVPMRTNLHKHDSNAFERFDEEDEESIDDVKVF